ncbi:MAG: AMP-binding protein [Candidatus Planktophila sp.]|nr:AMP-binding protein [Candidatus Planktophila sp.]
MDTSSHREVRTLGPTHTLAEYVSALDKALTSDGPALGCGPVHSTSVRSDISLLVATSGSTGTPKEIAITSSALLASATASNKFLKAAESDVWSLLLPLTHIAGINVLVRAMQLESTPLDLRNHVGAYPHADFTAIVPTQLFNALNENSELLKHLQGAKAVLVGGASLSPELRAQGIAAGINIVMTYGMSETSGGCVYDGVALDGVAFEITSDGRIKISGPVLAEVERENGWFVTNDLGKIVDGKLQIIGRTDDVIISGGENISLKAIEEQINREFPELLVAAFSTPDNKWGQALHIAVQSQDENIKSEISEALIKSIGNHAKPKSVLILDKLPQIGVGKVDRIALAKLVSQ